MPPTRHSMTEMHRSTHQTTGANIAAGKVPTSDGAGGVVWGDGSTVGFGPDRSLFFDHGNVGSTETIDLDDGAAHWITLDANCTLTFSGAVVTFDGEPVECRLTLYVEQDATGSRTVTWPGSVEWPGGTAPTLSTAAGSIDIFEFRTVDGGTFWFGESGGSGLIDYAEAGDIANVGTTASAGVSNEIPRADHVHDLDSSTLSGLGFVGEIVITDTPSTPLVFADLVQNEAEDDLVYADPL